ncbi:hypothetical protein Q3G72_030116 [Acer saccharum]|nr:hypothetical protein Q3G72_030116 [Acer saccharum]
MVNGMYVYGWPIKAKVASYDWSKRRNGNIGQNGRGLHSSGLFRGKEVEGSLNNQYARNGKSYAEATRAANPIKVEANRGMVMSWYGSDEEEEWLAKSAVGALKEFGSLDAVNQKLEDRGFIFSSTYIGGKHVLWSFESSFERDGFVSNSFFRRESFSSMKSWSDQTNIPSLDKIRWIEAYGVPLNCWSKAFFQKLGGIVGEVVWIEDKTELKQRLDCGRFMVLAPLEAQVSCEVQVNIGKKSVPVKLVEHQGLTTVEWVNKLLGLKQGISNLNQDLEGDGLEKKSSFSNKKGTREGKSRNVRGRDESLEIGMENNREMMGCKRAVREISDNAKLAREKVGGEMMDPDKGKGQWVHRQKPTVKQPRVAGAVIIDKKRISFSESSEEEYGSSDLGSNSEFGPDQRQVFYKGECSKRRSVVRKSTSGPGFGPNCPDLTLGDKDYYKEAESNRPKEDIIASDPRREAFKSGPTVKRLKGGNRDGMETSNGNGGAHFSDQMIRTSSTIQVVPETQFNNSQGIDIMVDFRNQGSEKESSTDSGEELVVDGMSDSEEEAKLTQKSEFKLKKVQIAKDDIRP